MISLENSTWESYLKYGKRQFYRQKDKIYCETEAGINGFYLLKKGMIRISTAIYDGQERILDLVSSLQPFGEQAADGDTYFSTAIALEDSIVYFMPSETIETLMSDDEQFRMLVYKNLTEKLITLSNNVLFNTLPSEQLVARTILTLVEKFTDTSIPFSQQELCRYTNLNRVTVYKVLKEWDERIVTLKNKYITVTNTKALEEIAAI